MKMQSNAGVTSLRRTTSQKLLVSTNELLQHLQVLNIDIIQAVESIPEDAPEEWIDLRDPFHNDSAESDEVTMRPGSEIIYPNDRNEINRRTRKYDPAVELVT